MWHVHLFVLAFKRRVARISTYTSLMLSDDIRSVDGVVGLVGSFWHLQWAMGVLLDLGMHSFAALVWLALLV